MLPKGLHVIDLGIGDLGLVKARNDLRRCQGRKSLNDDVTQGLARRGAFGI